MQLDPPGQAYKLDVNAFVSEFFLAFSWLLPIGSGFGLIGQGITYE